MCLSRRGHKRLTVWSVANRFIDRLKLFGVWAHFFLLGGYEPRLLRETDSLIVGNQDQLRNNARSVQSGDPFAAHASYPGYRLSAPTILMALRSTGDTRDSSR